MDTFKYKIYWSGQDWGLQYFIRDENGEQWDPIARSRFKWILRIHARQHARRIRRHLKNFGATYIFYLGGDE